MSYQVLARKWRPHSFDHVVGQSHVLTALNNALTHQRLHHAYLLSGTRGVGKTTIARIFAKGLNCEEGITATPCGVCQTCQEIDQGRFVDLLEIDAASRTKVEDTRELLDNVQYKPAKGRYKIYIIDEVHMLSRHSFNALLKTLEEPPEYVKFILATTDPQKLPITILSRCLQFHLKHLDVEQIQQQLQLILEKEEINFDSRALRMMARAADGSMRDALSLTDQAIALGNNQVNSDIVAEMLGTLDSSQALHLLAPLAQNDASAVMEQLNELASFGVEWDGLLKELANQFHQIAMLQALPGLFNPLDSDSEQQHSLAGKFAPEDIQLCYQIALQSRQDLALAPDGKAGVEMALLRMLAFRPAIKQSITPQSITIPATEPVSAINQGRELQAENKAISQSIAQPKASAPARSQINPAARAKAQLSEQKRQDQPSSSTQAQAPQKVQPQKLVQSQSDAPIQSTANDQQRVEKPSAAIQQSMVQQQKNQQSISSPARSMEQVSAHGASNDTSRNHLPSNDVSKNEAPQQNQQYDYDQANADRYDQQDNLDHDEQFASTPPDVAINTQVAVNNPPVKKTSANSLLSARNRLRSKMLADKGETPPVKKVDRR
ncbi:DNA polymerase III subunit gamma/tau [Vibrio sp. SS-MA-C1-2]|uniref:DNA polymerase III subunit gamma/tau n=1 Tax=Vibrio sp. SS-MA-C1-2 TaxID=2908646 RepID=UPI001F2AFA45|nr:DNA polymerase III subunit gamma/tau [Vibrio sp. SS-MA-C1-2]UJF18768.1 DNA polymerase III subunit gamma/tau [Vibrio sp. SS-MA-C1-2]